MSEARCLRRARLGLSGAALLSAIALALTWGGAQAADGGSRHQAQDRDHPNGRIRSVASKAQHGAVVRRLGVAVAVLELPDDLSASLDQVGQGPLMTLEAEVATKTAGPEAAQPSAVSAPPQAPVVNPFTLPPDPWPRRVQAGNQTLTVYSPQVESWNGDRIAFRTAVAVKPSGKGEEVFGVIQAHARTQVDRVEREVTFDDLGIVKALFATLPAEGEALAKAFGTVVRTVHLDRLEASLAAAGGMPSGGLVVRNTPPRIIVSETPAVLVPIQGPAAWRPVPGTGLRRVVNTRALILASETVGPFYLHLLDGWVKAGDLAGPWARAAEVPPGLDGVARRLAASGEADLLDGSPSIPTLDLLAAGPPAVYLSETPAELLVFKGPPHLVPIEGTGLRWADNTASDLIVDGSDGSHYVLLAGRWFKATTLNGPWGFVASSALPADFARIPATSPAGVVLAAVAATAQAREAAIADSIPQTATVPLVNGPSFSLQTDGPPVVGPLPGTDLEYVLNSATPVIRVKGGTCYALQAGIWFEAASLDGAWRLATSVPATIHAIPTSAPLHYVTYARIYGSTPELVYAGYTPGYLGTVLGDDGVLVYGTGYDPAPWIGDAWIAAPETYGLAAAPVYNPAVGHTYGFGLGLATAPMAGSYWGGTHYRPYGVGYGCCVVTSVNVYEYWGEAVAAGTRTWYAGGALVSAEARGAYGSLSGITDTPGARRGYEARGDVLPRGCGPTVEPTGAPGRGERYAPYTEALDSSTGEESSGAPEGRSSDGVPAADAGNGSRTAHQATVDDVDTVRTLAPARLADDLYAGVDGNVYRRTGGGWESHGAGGWQPVEGEFGWAERYRQSRAEGEGRVGAFSQGDWGDRFGGDLPQRPGGGFRERFVGGFGGRFGGSLSLQGQR